LVVGFRPDGGWDLDGSERDVLDVGFDFLSVSFADSFNTFGRLLSVGWKCSVRIFEKTVSTECGLGLDGFGFPGLIALDVVRWISGFGLEDMNLRV